MYPCISYCCIQGRNFVVICGEWRLRRGSHRTKSEVFPNAAISFVAFGMIRSWPMPASPACLRLTQRSERGEVDMWYVTITRASDKCLAKEILTSPRRCFLFVAILPRR